MENFDTLEELKKLSIERLFVLQKKELKLLEHYLINNLYCEEDYLNSIKELYIINSIITNKLTKNKSMKFL